MVTINIRQAEDPNSASVPLPDLIFDATGYADLVIENKDFSQENALFTCASIQLFTNLRDENSENLSSKDPQGWVGDAIIDNDFGAIGSYLWLLEQTFLSNELAGLAQGYAENAILPMQELGAIADYTVTTEINRQNKRLNLGIELIAKSNNEKYNKKFELVWGQIYG
jgi:phage gp46-like protein